jgi:hypothetical protein
MPLRRFCLRSPRILHVAALASSHTVSVGIRQNIGKSQVYILQNALSSREIHFACRAYAIGTSRLPTPQSFVLYPVSVWSFPVKRVII